MLGFSPIGSQAIGESPSASPTITIVSANGSSTCGSTVTGVGQVVTAGVTVISATGRCAGGSFVAAATTTIFAASGNCAGKSTVTGRPGVPAGVGVTCDDKLAIAVLPTEYIIEFISLV